MHNKRRYSTCSTSESHNYKSATEWVLNLLCCTWYSSFNVSSWGISRIIGRFPFCFVSCAKEYWGSNCCYFHGSVFEVFILSYIETWKNFELCYIKRLCGTWRKKKCVRERERDKKRDTEFLNNVLNMIEQYFKRPEEIIDGHTFI